MTYKVEIANSDISFEVNEKETISAAASRNNIQLSLACRMGACGACKGKLLSGSVQYEKQPFALSEEDKANQAVLLCTAIPVTDLVVQARGAKRIEAGPQKFKVKVVETQKINDTLIKLVIKKEEGGRFDFEAGQVINFMLPGDVQRSYSFASSATGHKHAELLIRHIPGGLFTGKLFDGEIKEGTILEAEAPLGTFTFKTPKGKKAVFLTTGTGIAPAMSILRTLIDKKDMDGRDITLFWGVPYASDLCYLSELQEMEARYPKFKFIPVVSREESWHGVKGRITIPAATELGDLTDTDAYLCGSTPMVRSVSDYLAVRCGLKEENVHSDAFGG